MTRNYLSAGIRYMENGAEDVKTRKSLERLGAVYFWRYVAEHSKAGMRAAV